MIILNKKYALRKIGKYFGPCIVGTVMMLGGAVIANPTVAHASVSASSTASDTNIHQIGSSNEGYEVIIPKGKKYIRNDESNNQTPKLVDPGYNGRSFIVKSDNYALFDEPSELFKKLYDKDGDGEIDEKYKNPKYPHVIDSGLTDDTDGSNNKPGVWEYKPDGRYKESDGVIDENDNMVVARKPFTINENAEDNVVNDDGSVVLTGDYKIHVNTGDHIDKKDDVYEVGTKPKVEETLVPFTTRYEKDDESPKGKETEVTPGVDGKTVTTTTYEVDPNTGKVIENPSTSVTTEPVTRVVKVGTKPKVVKKELPYTTRYVEDKTIDKNYRATTRAGVEGKETSTTTYTMNPDNGTVTENTPTVVREEPKEEIITIGTKPKVEETPIPYTTRYEKDDESPKGKETEVTPGVDGKTVTTTTYEVDPNTGKVTENPSTSVTTDPITRIVKVGTKPKVDETPIPFTTRYEKDDEAPKGKETEVTPGVDGKTVITTTYTVDSNTGKITENPSTSVTTKPVARVVKVGTQPKVDETPVPFTTRYEKDDDSPKGKETETTPGVDGKTVTTTTYEVDPNTGKVTENPSTSVTTDPVTRVVKVGTQPKVDEIVIPFEREYEDDSTMLPSEERKVRDGVNGKLTRTTNYDVDSQTGKVTEKVTEAREEPVNELYKRGTGVTSKIPFETTEKENPNILPSESGKVLVEGEEGVLHPDGKTVIKKPVNKVVEKGTGVTTPIPKGDYKVIEDPTLPEGQEIIDNEGEDGILHPDGKTVIRERIQPVKRVGKSVTSKGGENPPVVNEEKLIVTQYVNENGETIKTIEGQIDTPENYLKDEKGNITYQLDENKPKDENGGVVKYYYKTITTSKSTDIPPVHELPELKVIIVRDETGKEIKSYIESEFNKEDLDKEYDYIKGPEDKGNGITEYIYQTKINKPKDKLEVENINKLTDREKETLKEKVKEVNPDKFITIGEDGLIRLYDKEDKTDIVQTLKISDFIFVKPKQEKVEIVEVSQSSKLKEDKPVEAKEEPKERELPNTNSASVLTSLISSTIGSLGLAFTKRKKK